MLGPTLLKNAFRKRRFGGYVTICIAAFSHPDRSIVHVSDRAFSLPANLVENCAFKGQQLHRDWFAMTSGDLAQAVPILEEVVYKLVPGGHPAFVVGELVRSAWVDARARAAESRVLSPYGLTMNGFIAERTSDTHFAADVWPRLAKEIEAVTLDCGFVLCGFDPLGYPHVLSIFDGEVSDFGPTGYCAIGSGTDLATDLLTARRHHFGYDEPATIYNLLASRFVAEADPDVGKDKTLLAVVRWKEEPKIMSDDSINEIRGLMNLHGSTSGYAPGAGTDPLPETGFDVCEVPVRLVLP